MNSVQVKTKTNKLNQFIKFISNVTSINSRTTKQIKEKPQINHDSMVEV
jgi:hypothetical protein